MHDLVRHWHLFRIFLGSAPVVGWAMLAGLMGGLYLLTLQSYLLFHSFVEICRIVVVSGIAVLAWNGRRQIDNALLIFVGLSFPAVALMELLHTLSYKGMGLFGNDANLPTQLWIAFRGYESMALLAAALIGMVTRRTAALALAFNLIGIILLLTIWSGNFPDCFREGQGLTQFKILAEYAIAAVFASVLLLLFQRRELLPDEARNMVAAAIALDIAAELSFTQYVSVYGPANMIGHLLLLSAAYFMYRALLLKAFQEPMNLLFNQLQREKALLERSEAELSKKVAARTVELSQANARLQAELEERRRAQQKLMESQEMVRSTHAVALDAMIVIDELGRIMDWNPAAERMFGYTPDAALGRSLHDLIAPPRYRMDYQRGLANFGRSGTGPALGKIVELQALRKDGSEFPVELAVSSLQIQGRWHAVGVVRDITERKAAAQARDELAAIVESSQEAIFGKDLEGIITSWNSGAENLYGYRAEEMIGQPITRLVPPARRDEIIQLTGRVAQGEQISNFETERICKDGRYIDVILTLSPIRDSSETITGISTIVHNISERKQAERNLQRSNRSLRFLSASNQTLLHAESEPGLLGRMCSIITEVGGYAGAWIAFLEEGRMVPRQTSNALLEAALNAPDLKENPPAALGEALASGQTVRLADPIMVDGLMLRLVLPLKQEDRVFGCIAVLARDEAPIGADEIAILEELAGDLSFGVANLRNKLSHEQNLQMLARTLKDTVRAIASTVEMRDVYTAGHQRRVAELAVAIASEMALDADSVQGIELAASIHDLGKINIPSEILTKPARLSDIEFAMIKAHPSQGYEIIKDIEFPWPIAQAVLQHHERMDGSGYPHGLKGEEIALEARIIAVSDMVEAMSSHRPYRAGLGVDAALAELARCRGIGFDAEAVDACLRVFHEKGFQFSDIWGGPPK